MNAFVIHCVSYYIAFLCIYLVYVVKRTAVSVKPLITDGLTVLLFYRSVKKSDEDVPVPPLFKSAALWGMC